MGIIIGLLGLLGFLITLVILIVRTIKKKPKKVVALLLPCFLACFVIGVILTPTTLTANSNESTGVAQNSSASIEDESTSTPVVEDSASLPQEDTKDMEFYSATTNEDPISDIVSDGIAEKLVSFGFTNDEAQEIRKIFVQCGVSSLEGCEPTDPSATIDGLVSYRAVWDKDRTFWFTVDNRVY